MGAACCHARSPGESLTSFWWPFSATRQISHSREKRCAQVYDLRAVLSFNDTTHASGESPFFGRAVARLNGRHGRDVAFRRHGREAHVRGISGAHLQRDFHSTYGGNRSLPRILTAVVGNLCCRNTGTSPSSSVDSSVHCDQDQYRPQMPWWSCRYSLRPHQYPRSLMKNLLVCKMFLQQYAVRKTSTRTQPTYVCWAVEKVEARRIKIGQISAERLALLKIDGRMAQQKAGASGSEENDDFVDLSSSSTCSSSLHPGFSHGSNTHGSMESRR